MSSGTIFRYISFIYSSELSLNVSYPINRRESVSENCLVGQTCREHSSNTNTLIVQLYMSPVINDLHGSYSIEC